MSDPEFLDLEDALAIHREQLARFGGGAGIRDAGLLDSALATPRATFGGSYVHGDVFSMAAAYAFHVAENQPFVDGNKRTGLLCAVVFLEIGSDREKPLVLTRGKRDLSTAPKLGGCALGGLLSLSTPRARDDRRPAVCRDRFQSRAHGREERRQEGYEEAEHRAGEDPDPGRDRQRFHWEFSLDDKITHASDGALRIYGLARDKFHLAEAQALVLAECRPVLDTASSDLIEKGAKYDIEFKIRRASDGKVVDIHSRAEYDPRDRRVFGVIQDITLKKLEETEKEALQTKLALASRLAAMGTLVAGVSHEINNPLTGVMAGVGTAMLDVQDHLEKLERGDRPSQEALIERGREVLEMLRGTRPGTDSTAGLGHRRRGDALASEQRPYPGDGERGGPWCSRREGFSGATGAGPGEPPDQRGQGHPPRSEGDDPDPARRWFTRHGPPGSGGPRNRDRPCQPEQDLRPLLHDSPAGREARYRPRPFHLPRHHHRPRGNHHRRDRGREGVHVPGGTAGGACGAGGRPLVRVSPALAPVAQFEGDPAAAPSPRNTPPETTRLHSAGRSGACRVARLPHRGSSLCPPGRHRSF